MADVLHRVFSIIIYLIFFSFFIFFVGFSIENGDYRSALIMGFILSTVGYILYVADIFGIKKRRIEFINNYEMPKSVLEKFKVHYPNLTAWEIEDVVNGLKIYFSCCSTSNTYAWMPSKVVDMLWHEFILNTIEYEKFCKKASGKFFHHILANYKPSYSKQQAGLKNIWQYSCQKEGMDSRTATVLPLLFAIDSQLDIPNGRHYDLEEAGKDWGYVPPPVNNYSGGGGDGSGGDGGGCGGGCGGSG